MTAPPHTFTIPKATCAVRVVWREQTAPLLTWTSTMEAWSWSLPAGPINAGGSCAPWSSGPDAVCACCYAMGGRYSFRKILSIQAVRFHWFKDALRKDADGLAEFLAHSIGLHACNGYFRIHDSGDFHNLAAVRCWTQVARALPAVRIWCPTRAHRLPGWRRALRELADAGVVVRPSALDTEQPPPTVANLAAGSAVYRGPIPSAVYSCPKLNGSDPDGHSCEAQRCRTCWDSPDTPIGYRYHGRRIGSTAKGRRRVALTIYGRKSPQ